ncbi:MAG: substrate-binding domain-containing protein, partial [Acetobacteraceae bacterium]|nr:substrate-binding domain-containing protein [Acetobacteraceae bacterium]
MNRRELLARTALLGLGATVGSKLTLRSRAAIAAPDPAAALAQVSKTILVKDVHGVPAAPVSTVKLSEGELAKIKGMNATAAIIMHYGGNDWSRAQIQALQTQFASMGIKVIAVTDAGFKAEKQVSDIETVLAQKPNIIIGVPVDPEATARAFKTAAEQGVKIVLANFAPNGLAAGKDYVSVVSADEYGNGIASALLLVQAVGGKGEVGLVYHAADFQVTRQRY